MKVIEESFVIGPSSSSSRPIHVYLSFKGDDETCRFTDMLWAALETDDLNTFWDDKKLEPGDSISLPRHFLKPIRQSNISIVVFSKNYASSIWCLEELSEIAARIHEPRYTVFPIFCDVDPSEIQNQSNSFEKAFAQHEQRFPTNLCKAHIWRSAINQVANLSAGWDVPYDPYPRVIDDIVIEVKKKVRQLEYVDADLVGMPSRVREIEKLLELGMNDEVRMLGICGMGGAGKTTFARVLHDRISHHFYASHFIINASEFHKVASQEYLKNNILENILVVIDGIRLPLYVNQMISLVNSNMLGGGSRIIIVTRDEGDLKWFGKHYIYRFKLLNKDEALQLFCKKAFKCDFPVRGYEEQIDSALQYASGLPLAIVILGHFLYNSRGPQKHFDEMDHKCKETFLDMACFFNEKNIKFVEGILDSVYRFSLDDILRPVKYNIQVVIEKSLMAIIDQKIQMHSLVQEMGRAIVRHEFPCRPEEWSRLWDFDDIFGVMQNDTATLKVEAIVLELEDSQGRTLRAEGLSRMRDLRLLIFRNVKFSGVLKHLSLMLQYISWHQYPFTSLPSSFHPFYLAELVLPDSRVTSIWDDDEGKVVKRWKRFYRLRNMNLSGSKDLIKLPNFESLPILQRLELEGCSKLSQLDSSMASLSTLEFLNLRNCSNLVSIPNDLFSLSSLKMLNLAGCSKFAYCLKFLPFDAVLGGRKIIQQSFLPCKRKTLWFESQFCRKQSLRRVKNGEKLKRSQPPRPPGENAAEDQTEEDEGVSVKGAAAPKLSRSKPVR
ncbi:TMV resistance protein N-like [Neltuma alba]|uniref:TMV resistance protein N-like n=1 Tax=Neltuma alba TaxID=207710 RepID=UPI0010A396CD|nr:TMV resistance protein N-like [Prosopis alba]